MKIPWYLMAKGKGGGTKTASGPIAHWTDGVDAPLKSLLVNIDPVQAGSGDPSPDNVRPISGWSAVNVWVKPTYDPTANPTATLQLGQTVYGGTLDVTNGVLTVDRVLYEATSVNSVTLHNSGYRYWTVTTGLESVNTASGYPSNMFKNASGVVPGNWYVTGNGSTLVAIPYADQQSITNKSGANAWLAEHPAQFVCPLATPIEYTLTPQQISSLVGENNVWADTGDVTVEYESSGGSDPNLMKLVVAFMGRE